MDKILLAIEVLCGISLALTLLLLVAEFFFANYGDCEIDINNGDKKITAKGGGSLLSTLSEDKVFIPSACGGRGSCGFCKCKVDKGGGPVLPTETPYLSEEELKNNVRLSCQIKVKEDIAIRIPEELLSVKEFETTVESITDLTHDIKGVRFKLPEGETVRIKAGQYIQLVAPPYDEVHEPTSRAYSIASRPSDDEAIDLIIRLVPNGIVTTYVFEHLKEGDKAKLVGPFGDFYLRDTDKECIFIAGGSGLAPFRSMLYDMIEKGIKRKTTFFFGAVGLRDLYFVEEFAKLSEEHSWFKFVPALSGKEEGHSYERGLITDVVARSFEKMDNHEGYLCGSPGMIDACVRVLTAGGIPEDQIFYDKFA
ncbi:MAG: 2Fe-2S iron-sulfur cluster binding domain-containing protein [Planctomycetes bacterium]|nr:2Fe-2S iron-sulfur cluster binding domain-containing protein [Planctomycetota bacterium]